MLILLVVGHTAQAQVDRHPIDVAPLDELGEADFQRMLVTCDSLSTAINDHGMVPPEWKDFYEECDLMKENYWDAIFPGCSWYCGGGPDSISASNRNLVREPTLNDPSKAHDLNFLKGWGGEPGDRISYHFKAASPRITQILVANGYVSDSERWQEYGRVRSLDIYFNEELLVKLHLEDSQSVQTFDVPLIGVDPIEWSTLPSHAAYDLTFQIGSIYPGTQHNTAVLAEIYFDGIDDH